MGRGIWLLGGAAVGLGVIALATRAARAASAAPGLVLVGEERQCDLEVERVAVTSAAGAVEVGSRLVPPAALPVTAARVLPLVRARVSPNGAFRAIRTKGRGHCRHGYPCTHYGVDLVPESYYRGPIVEVEWWVRAPEEMVVDVVVRDDETPPLSGYGPGAVLARGRSGTWHLFGHLSPRSFPAWLVKGAVIRLGQFFARLAALVRPPHVHYEPRRWRTEGPASRALGRPATRADIVIDPDLWLREAT